MIEQICIWYTAGIDQRKHELERGESLEGTKGWNDRGCFECRGLDKTKGCYLCLNTIEEQELNDLADLK